MGYKQDRSFDTSKAGSKSGYCLQNIREGYGIASKYPNATQAWNNTVQHKDRSIPSGIAVPLFYGYKTDGHVNVRLPDGRIYNDGQYYANLPAYESTHPAVKYLGWGETLNGIRVLSYTPETKPSKSTGKRLYFDPIGQTATFYPVKGGTFAMKIKDASYNWNVLEDQGYRVRVNSASAGGDCWVYIIYQTGSNKGKVIPGRSVR